ncbi:hypothetical protein [Planomonospora venezuelensis]|uniref:Uncharacterized protein n=1 Tax=Planomonospora venezuelensis TaxID=1999 RepID=A0A841D706_PLAVE|nr:hypothetical protein [Planomonospora venezuelensis]MBB5965259.1 hypothetical protein [Planomonospora venezuelensis]GIN00507.1 hypothetical protein Pve01_21650 [Planomonospora venezuelensis]
MKRRIASVALAATALLAVAPAAHAGTAQAGTCIRIPHIWLYSGPPNGLPILVFDWKTICF